MTTSQILTDLGIESALFDADDTLFRTHLLFGQVLGSVKQMLSDKYGLVREQVDAKFEQLNNEAHQLYHVNPVPTWNYVYSGLVSHFGLPDSEVTNCTHLTSQIYSMVPELIPGAWELVMKFKAAGIKCALVTHATPEWTMVKLGGHDMLEAFDHLEIVPVDVEKHAGVWTNALIGLNTSPSQAIAIGDNLRGDVLAAETAGIAHLVWINHPESWQMYKRGEKPDHVIEVESLRQMMPALALRREERLRLR